MTISARAALKRLRRALVEAAEHRGEKDEHRTEVLTPTFLSNSPTMLRAEILADVASGALQRLSPANSPGAQHYL